MGCNFCFVCHVFERDLLALGKLGWVIKLKVGLAILFFVTPFCIIYFLKKISRLEESIEKLHEAILDQKLTTCIRD